MARFALGLFIGLAIGAFVVFRLEWSRHGEKESAKSLLARREAALASLEQEKHNLSEEKGKAEMQLKHALAKKEQLDEKLDRLEHELNQANKAAAALKTHAESLEKKISEGKPAAQPAAQPDAAQTPPGPEDELAALRKQAMKRYESIMEVGQPLSEDAVRELELDRAAADRINSVLAEELARATAAVARFHADTQPAAGDAPAQMDVQTLLLKALPGLMDDFEKLRKLSPEDHLKIMKGEADLLDYLPADSKMVKLARVLHDVRRETHAQLEREMPADRLSTLKERYLPPGDFRFSGNLNLMFGKIDWEKRR
jgi:hypothetical protein